MIDNNSSNKCPQVAMNTRFSQFVSEKSLNLTRQELTDGDMPEIIQFLTQNPAIKNLNLSLNHIGDEGIVMLAEYNQTIAHLNLSGNNITDQGIADFATKNQHIIEANFSHNLITEKGIESFAHLNQTCYSSKFSKIQYH